MRDGKRERSQDRWDVIVIGSGMGGLLAAAALSRTGHTVQIDYTAPPFLQIEHAAAFFMPQEAVTIGELS